MEEQKYSFENSLKSIETENRLDRIFYRPIGYKIALILAKTSITPNMVTIVSIFLGVFAGIMFYPQNVWINLAGFAILVVANILDCVDGQLARLTGIKSPMGRILDGFAGDLWFVSIYINIALRLSTEMSITLAWTIVVLAGVSNLIQSNITDYYKTAHLYFISLKKGEEFDTVAQVKARYSSMSKGFNKALYWLYVRYTIVQTSITPQMRKMLERLIAKYGEDFPQEVRQKLRANSLKVMPLLNIITFNGRSIALFIAIATQTFWIYLAFEIVVLNAMLITAITLNEKQCKSFDS